MAEKVKKSFIMYTDMYKPTELLTLSQKGELWDAVFRYHSDDDVNISDPVVKIAFEFFRQQFSRDDEKYNEVREKRRISGSLGGIAKSANASKSKQNEANVAVNVNDNDNVNDINIKDTNVSLSFPPEKDEQAEESVPRETVPVQRILDLYREELPFLRQPRMIRPNVAASIKARWHEKQKEGKFRDEEGGLEYFRHVFRYVSQNAFLSGRKTNWKADFEWIVKAANWDKITTGKYAEDDGK